MPTIVNDVDDTKADTPPVFDVDGTALPNGTSDRVCKSCGKPLPEFHGRGRKPVYCDDCKAAKAATRTSSSPRRGSNQDVTKALAAMDTIYSAMIMGGQLLSPKLAAQWAANKDQAQALNQQAFELDRKLAKKVATIGVPGGMTAFIAAQGLMLYPVAVAIASRPHKPKAKHKPVATPGEPAKDNNHSLPNAEFFG